MRLPSMLGLCFLMAGIVAYAQSNAPRSYTADGKTISYRLTVFNPPIAIQPDQNRLNQDTAANCTIFFLSKLTKGDIAGAAALTTFPEETAKMYSDARSRMGEAEFSKQLSQLFNGDRYLYELVVGDNHVLIGEKVPDGAQALVVKNGKFFMEQLNTVHTSPVYQDLFKLVNDHAAGKLELK